MKYLIFILIVLILNIVRQKQNFVFGAVSLKVSSLTAEITNGLFTIKIINGTANSLVINGKELIGNARGFYSSINGDTNFNSTDMKIVTETQDMVDIAYTNSWGHLHYVVRDNVNGIYSYFEITGLGSVGEFRTLYRVDGNIFRSGHNAERSGPFPTLADIQKGEKLQDETWRLADGTIYTKYNWATYVTDDWSHGVYGGGYGVYMITASHEYFNGGPMKQELMVHVESSTNDGVVLNMLSASHFGSPTEKVPEGKIYGPWLVYFNDGNSSDADARAETERAAWPYSWLSNTHYPLTRATVTGTLKLSDGRAASGAMVVLAKPGGDIYAQGADYIYWSSADSSGAFSIPHVRSGTYSLYAYAQGGAIGDVTDQLEKDNVAVSGTSTSLGTITWSPPKYTHKLWQIGTADRKTKEFNLGNSPRAYGLNTKVPPNLTFSIGSSKEATDWYYAQTYAGTWNIAFSLNETYTGTAHLSIAKAGQSRAATVQVLVNGKSIGNIPSHANDMTIYRSGNPSGYYHLALLTFPSSNLKSGANIIAIQATKVEDGGGMLYDTIKLEVD